MTPDAPHRPRRQHVAATGATVIGVLLPLAAGVLLARTLGSDPLTPVNAMITQSGQRAGALPSQWRGCGRHALRGRKEAARAVALRVRRAAGRRAMARTPESAGSAS
ncbi:hypothetical protein [Streptomyces sp. NPDC002889]|uniref:hypothetical protein n=1 Tax=Streptomyces sp. NPDC002889 TaxID=3364669 RepID=UPI0036CBF35B